MMMACKSCLYILAVFCCDFTSACSSECVSCEEFQWNSWSDWSICNQTNPCTPGFKTRERTLAGIFACCDCAFEMDQVPCGTDNNACNQKCNPISGRCACEDGFVLNSDGKTCQEQLCAQIKQYNCPLEVSDKKYGSKCKEIKITCPNGVRVGKECHLSCYFPDMKHKYNINNAESPTINPLKNVLLKCVTVSNANVWNDTHARKYFCRRVNDPPKNITISSSSILEHSKINTTIGIFSATDDLAQKLTFSISQSKESKKFAIYGNVLKNTEKPVLHVLSHNTIQLKIKAEDNFADDPMIAEKLFNITIINVNDPPNKIRISNNKFTDLTPVNGIIGKLSAIDFEDEDPKFTSDDYVWSLTENHPSFALNGSNLILIERFSDTDTFIVVITVRGAEKKAAKVFLDQNITLIHSSANNKPENLTLNIVSLYEDLIAGDIIGSVSASDKEGQQINFQILKNTEVFGVSTTTCVTSTTIHCTANLTLLKDLDFEVQSEYTFAIKAVDDLGEFAYEEFPVVILNVNEAPYNMLTENLFISENSSPGTYAGHIKVFDYDENDFITCKTEDETFQVSGENLLLQTNQVLDFEAKSSYDVEIVCHDSGVPALLISKTVEIKIRDVNEAPTHLCLSRTVVHTYHNDSQLAHILIEDPDLHNTKDLCDSKKTITTILPYECTIKGDAADWLFVTEDLIIRNTKEINYLQLNGSIHFRLSCVDKTSPRNLIQTSFTLILDKPTCPERFVWVEDKCFCRQGYSAPDCDRKLSLCISNDLCTSSEICSAVYFAKHRCATVNYQLPILFSVPHGRFYHGNYRYEIEKFVEDLLLGKNATFPDKADRRSHENFTPVYLESASILPISESKSLVKFIPLDSNYEFVEAARLCERLQGTIVTCLNQSECDLVKSAGYSCPLTMEIVIDNGNADSGLEPWLYVVIALVTLLIVVTLIALVCYRRREKKQVSVVFYNNEMGANETVRPNDILVIPNATSRYSEPDAGINNQLQFENMVYECETEQIYSTIDNKAEEQKYWDLRKSNIYEVPVKKCEVDLPKQEESQAPRYESTSSSSHTSVNRYNPGDGNNYNKLNRKVTFPR